MGMEVIVKKVGLSLFALILILPYISAIICNSDLPNGCPEEQIVQAVATNTSTYSVNNTNCWLGHCTNDISWTTGYIETDPVASATITANQDSWLSTFNSTYDNYVTLNQSNSTKFWQGMNSINATQLQNTTGVLSINWTWLSNTFSGLYCLIGGNCALGNITVSWINSLGILVQQDATNTNITFNANCTGTNCVSPPQIILPDVYNFTGTNFYVDKNATINIPYGEMLWAATDPENTSQWLKPTVFTTANTFYNFSNATAGYSLSAITNGFSFSGGNALTSQIAGLYKFDGTCDYYTKSGAHTDITLFVNGIATNMTTHRTAGSPSTIQPVSIQNVTSSPSNFASDLLYADGTGYTLTEANGGIPVLDANFTFQLSGTPVVLTNPLFLTFSGYYLGSDSHEIEVSVWNYTSGAWVQIRSAIKDLPNSGLIPYTQTWKFPEGTQDTVHNMMNSTGAIKVRIEHTTNGVSSHILFIDQFVLSERRVYDRQTITGLVRIKVGDQAYVMMKKDFANAMPQIQRFDVNLLRVGN